MSQENVEATHQASHRLNSVIEELEATRWAAHLTDAEWTLVWVSSELQALLGTQDPEELGVGRHLLDRAPPPFITIHPIASRGSLFSKLKGRLAPQT